MIQRSEGQFYGHLSCHPIREPRCNSPEHSNMRLEVQIEHDPWEAPLRTSGDIRNNKTQVRKAAAGHNVHDTTCVTNDNAISCIIIHL